MRDKNGFFNPDKYAFKFFTIRIYVKIADMSLQFACIKVRHFRNRYFPRLHRLSLSVSLSLPSSLSLFLSLSGNSNGVKAIPEPPGNRLRPLWIRVTAAHSQILEVSRWSLHHTELIGLIKSPNYSRAHGFSSD